MSATFDPNIEHDPVFRMPVVLGPASGPRNMPKSKMHLRFDGDTQVLMVSATSTPAALSRIVPPRCKPLDGARLDVIAYCQKNLGWLAGRGYNIVAIRIPVLFDSKAGPVEMNFTPVLWENMADPVLTGREELGSPKLFASIPDLRRSGAGMTATAEWEGFRFFDMSVDELTPTESPLPAVRPNLLYRYHSRVGDWQHADLEQMTRATPGKGPAPKISNHRVGNGRFKFYPAQWEDMPTQYTYVRALADLPIEEFGRAHYYEMSGITDLMAQDIVE